MSRAAFRALLENGDVQALRAAWATVMPGLPQPETHEAAEIGMHVARTQAQSVTFRARAYSHRWLTERNLPSHLPDILKPKAERMFPVVVEGVGIFVRPSSNEYFRPAQLEVRGAMEDAINDAYAEGCTDPEFVKARMAEAKDKTMRQLFGRKP